MDKKLVVRKECEIEIPKAGMIIKFDGTTVQIGFIANTELVVDGDLRIATTGDFEVVSNGDATLSTYGDGKVHLGDIEKIYDAKSKIKEIE